MTPESWWLLWAAITSFSFTLSLTNIIRVLAEIRDELRELNRS